MARSNHTGGAGAIRQSPTINANGRTHVHVPQRHSPHMHDTRTGGAALRRLHTIAPASRRLQPSFHTVSMAMLHSTHAHRPAHMRHATCVSSRPRIDRRSQFACVITHANPRPAIPASKTCATAHIPHAITRDRGARHEQTDTRLAPAGIMPPLPLF